MWKSFFALFRDDPSQEQVLYQAVAKCGTLLLQIGDVAKIPEPPTTIEQRTQPDSNEPSSSSVALDETSTASEEPAVNENFIFIPKLIDPDALSVSSTGFLNVKEDVKLVDVDDTTNETSEEPIATHLPVCVDTTSVATSSSSTQGCSSSKSPSKSSAEGGLDTEWTIQYGQFLACMLSEPDIIAHFERPYDLKGAMLKYRTDIEYKASPMSP